MPFELRNLWVNFWILFRKIFLLPLCWNTYFIALYINRNSHHNPCLLFAVSSPHHHPTSVCLCHHHHVWTIAVRSKDHGVLEDPERGQEDGSKQCHTDGWPRMTCRSRREKRPGEESLTLDLAALYSLIQKSLQTQERELFKQEQRWRNVQVELNSFRDELEQRGDGGGAPMAPSVSGTPSC